MYRRFCMILFVGALLEWRTVASAPPEKGRAYEFGFSIEEQQHRHEKRDENGIVMGEFGFITADGIYHVTVYATDENGKFKILAMKNYPYRSPEKKIMIAMVPQVKKPAVIADIRKAIPTDTKSCGGCVLTKKLVPQPADVAKQIPGNKGFKPLSRTFNDATEVNKNILPSVGDLKPKGMPLLPSLPLQPNPIGDIPSKVMPGLQSMNSKPNGQVPANGQENTFALNKPQIDVRLLFPQTMNLLPSVPQMPSVGGAKATTPSLPSTAKLTPSSQSIGKTITSSNGGGPLYRFNYVLDYNSHREEGRLDGSKEGNYKAIGEDGIRRIIDYIANENGYQPHIKWERVPPNEQPTGENKLKEYEFVWFNRA